VGEVGDIVSLDGQNDIAALQVRLGRSARLNPLDDQGRVEVLSSGKSEAPGRREGIPVNVDLHLVSERHLGDSGGGC